MVSLTEGTEGVKSKKLWSAKKLVIIFIFIFGLMGYGLYKYFSVPDPTEILFAQSNDNGTLSNFTNEFSAGGHLNIQYAIYGDGNEIDIIIERVYENGMHSVVKREKKKYPSDWMNGTIVSSMNAPIESGNYLMKIFNIKEDTVIAKGEFKVH